MADLSKRKYKTIDIVGGGLCLLLLAAGGLMVVRQGLQGTRALAEEQRMLAQELTQLTEAATVVQRAEALLEDLRAGNTETPRTPLPQRPDFSGFYAAVLAIASEHDINLARLQPADALALDSYRVLPVSIQLDGRYEDFYRFLGGILRDTNYCKVVDMRLAATPQPGHCSVTMSLQLFGKGTETET